MSATKARLDAMLDAGLDPYGVDEAWMIQCAAPLQLVGDIVSRFGDIVSGIGSAMSSAGPLWCAECGDPFAAIYSVSIIEGDRTEICGDCGRELAND